jgi:lipoprotein-anchoring transpeptidase ErfK/SrfK
MPLRPRHALLVALASASLGCKPSRAAALDAARDATLDARDAAQPDVAADVTVDARRRAGPPLVPFTRVMATTIWTPVHTQPDRHSKNMGYLRAGAVVDAVEGPVNPMTCVVHRRSQHPEGGWYRIRDGGYVCVGGAMASGWPNRDFMAPVQPDYDAGMPYRMGIIYGMTVAYRRLPTTEDLHLFEPWRYANTPDEQYDNSEAPRPAGAPPVRAHPRTLDELRGPGSSAMIRRLTVGMYVALDRVFRDDAVGERYWHTQSGAYIRQSRMGDVHHWSNSHGATLDDAVTLPYAFVISELAYNYRASPTGSLGAHHRIPRLSGVALADAPPIMAGGRWAYYRTADGMAVSARQVRRATRQPPPEGVGPAEKWIDVDLDEQILVAYEGARPVYTTLVSSGRAGDDRAHNFETPEGSYRILSKHVSNTMDGETPNGVYSFEDVPWVMYFQGSYALHGAFWHSHFGWRMSHGCVNLAPLDARWLAYWSDPPLPEHWHGVYATPERLGSRVIIRHSRANQHADEDRPAEANAEAAGGN